MTQPGSIANLMPAGPDWIPQEFAQIRRELQAIRGARRLEAATIGSGGLHVRGGNIWLEDTDGNILATLDGSGIKLNGGAFKVDDADGNLLLTLDKDGLTATALGRIGNAALAAPVYPAVANQSASGAGLFTTGTDDYASVTVDVPTGYTQALVHATASATVSLPQVAGDASFTVQAVIGSEASDVVQTEVPEASESAATASLAWSGTVSGSFTIATRVDLTRAASATSYCGALTSATVLFLR